MSFVYQLERELLRRSIQKHAHYLTGSCLDIGSRGKESRYRDYLSVGGYVSLDPDASCEPDVVASAEALPFFSETFDSILCTQVLDDIPDPKEALREFNRVLKVGGMVLISVPVTAPLPSDGADLWRFTPKGLRLLFTEAGFEVIDEENIGGAFSIRNQILTTIIKDKLSLGTRNRLIRGVCNKLFMMYGAICKRMDTASPQYVMDFLLVARKR